MTAIRPAVETRSETDFSLVGQHYCRECKAPLNLRPREGPPELIGYHVEDVVNVGARKKVGSAYVCKSCGFDEGVQAARLRRVATVRHRGNYVE
jgi:hypothetical protein